MPSSNKEHLHTSSSHTIPFALSKGKRSGLSTRTEDSSPPSLNILLAEDEHISRLLIAQVLAKLGHNVTSVKNGREALEVLSGHESFDVLLTDIQMPQVDGIELTTILRSEKQYQSIAQFPIIAMTAYAMAGDRENYLKAGMDDYIPKPVDPKLLEIILGQLTGRPQ